MTLKIICNIVKWVEQSFNYKQWQGCMKMKSKKVFYLLSFSLLLTFVACGDSPKQIKETAESQDESGVLDPGDPYLFQERIGKTRNAELKKE
jgi:hypothetical protein